MNLRTCIWMLFVLIGFFRLGATDNPDALRWRCSQAFEKRDFKSAYDNALLYYDAVRNDTTTVDYGYANFYLGASEVFIGDSNKGAYYLNIARHVGEQTDNDSLVGLALNCLGIYEAKVNYNYYLAQHYLLSSLDYPGIKGSVYSNLAQIARLQRDTTGMTYARKCYEYGIENHDSYYIYSGLISLAEFEIQKELYDQADSTLNKARKVAACENFRDRSRLDFLHAVIMSHMGDPAGSNDILLALHDTIAHCTPLYLAELQFVVGKNFELQGEYDMSNIWLERALESSDKYSSNDYTTMIYRQLADNYNILNDKDKALEYMNKAYDMQQKAIVSERDRMSRERQLTMDIMLREKERAIAVQQVRTQRIVLVFVLILLIVSFGIIWYVIRTLRRRNSLYRRIVSSNLAIIEEKERYRARIDYLENNKTDTNYIINRHVSPERQSKTVELFDALQSLMTDRQMFRNPLLTREEVIDELKTNSTYLTQCIRERANKNYSQYINSFRIQAAVELLSDKSLITIPIKDIAERAGFNSLTTFYKLFQEAIGMSPAAYRKSLKSL